MKKKIAITAGVFDCFHEGHANLLKYMNICADQVVVFLHDDLSTYQNKGRFTVQRLEHRSSNLFQSKLVTQVAHEYERNPGTQIVDFVIKLIRNSYGTLTLKDFVYIRGDDWQDFPGRNQIELAGIEVRLVPYTKGVSTTMIRNQLKS